MCSKFERRRTIYSYFDFGLKTAAFGSLTDALAPLPIALESCSRAQADRPVFYTALEKKICLYGAQIFCD